MLRSAHTHDIDARMLVVVFRDLDNLTVRVLRPFPEELHDFHPVHLDAARAAAPPRHAHGAAGV